ncbi:MAG: hypothetical protein IH946_01080 [Bacteroidetes bacterium]|nr:hypothetical protein [Bacteroidota bacterium]
MRALITRLLPLLMFLPGLAIAGGVSIKQQTKQIEGETFNGYAVFLNGEARDITDFWTNYLSTNYSIKLEDLVVQPDYELKTARDIYLTEVTNLKSTFYTTLTSSENGVEITIFLANDIILKNGTERFIEMENTERFLRRFVKFYFEKNYQHYLDELRKEMIKSENGMNRINYKADKLKRGYSKKFKYLGDANENDKKIMKKVKELEPGFFEFRQRYDEAYLKYQEKVEFIAGI